MKGSKTYTTKETTSLISSIKRGGDKGAIALDRIYRDYDYKAYLNQIIKNTSLDLASINDVVHDSFLIFRRNVRKGKVNKDVNIPVYITSIAKNIIQNKQRKKNLLNADPIENPHSSVYGVQDSVDTFYFQKESKKVLDAFLMKLNDKCKDLLKLWKLNYSYDEIAEELNLANREIAKKRKFRCFKKLIEEVEDFPELKVFLS